MAQEPEGSNAVVAWDTDGNSVNKKAFLGSTNNKPLVLKTNNVERMRVTQDGKVGVGTAKPQVTLHVVGANSRQRLESSDKNVWTAFEYKTDIREWHTGVGGSEVPNDIKGKFYIHDATSGLTRMVVDADGRVGIGTTSPGAPLEVANGRLRLSGFNGDIEFTEAADLIAYTTIENPDPASEAFRVDTGSFLTRVFTVRNDGTAQLGALGDASAKYVCISNALVLGHCSSSAEYVPTINGGTGYPEPADLVSIAPSVENPYGDAHGPFAVEKSSRACDNNLLGFIVKPELGANGVTLNDRYLPLAMYGYFPAKVTMENGAIKRGDPITSSSKAGYGMKATDACKVIGYALEDANTEGTVQVFADLGDNSAAHVAELRAENVSLRKELMSIQASIAALKDSMQPGASRTKVR